MAADSSLGPVRIEPTASVNLPRGWPWPESANKGGRLRIGHLLPPGFERYLRIFHPFENRAGPKSGSTSTGGDLSWREMAVRLGVPFHESVLDQLILPYQETEQSEFGLRCGYLESKTMAALLTALQPSTGSAPVFFYYGLSAQIRNPDHQPLMWRGTLTDIWHVQHEANGILGEPILPYSPEWMWPENRSWFVLTDFDLPSTYVAASADVAQAILQQADLEVVDVAPETPINLFA
jgi:hypothetical protein